MEHKPLFSIATPCFNSVKTIERTIKSILAQKFKDYEYIIVDGGSTDGSLDIIQKYEPMFEGRMKWKSEPDKGIYDAFNKGCQRAIGRFVWIVNSDDWMEDGALQKIANIDLNDNQIVIGGLNWIDERGEVYRTSIFNKRKIDYAYKTNRMIPHPATIVPKHIYEKYGYYNIKFKIAGDLDWFHRIYPKSDVQFTVINSPLNNMTIGGVSTSSNFKKEIRERKIFFKNKYGLGLRYMYNLLIWIVRYLRK